MLDISVAITKHYQCTSVRIGQSLQVLLSTQPCEQSNWPIYCAISPKMAEILYGHCVCDTVSCTTICGREKCAIISYMLDILQEILLALFSRVFMQSVLRCKESNRIFLANFRPSSQIFEKKHTNVVLKIVSAYSYFFKNYNLGIQNQQLWSFTTITTNNWLSVEKKHLLWLVVQFRKLKFQHIRFKNVW